MMRNNLQGSPSDKLKLDKVKYSKYMRYKLLERSKLDKELHTLGI